LKYADAASDVGGFYIFISYVFSKLVNCVNEKAYRKYLFHDSYLVHYNKDFWKIPTKKGKKSVTLINKEKTKKDVEKKKIEDQKKIEEKMKNSIWNKFKRAPKEKKPEEKKSVAS